MGRPPSSAKKAAEAAKAPPNEETEQRRRLKQLAFAKGVLSKRPAEPRQSLSPSQLVLKHGDADVVKKGQRKNRFLFSLPGLMAPLAGGKVGELKDVGTKNPILYLEFPQGRMKLFGTIVYPKNKYLTLQFSRGGKSVICEDSFESMVVFSEAWWIGRKEDNPEESKLEFPSQFQQDKEVDHDFKGGAGASLMETNTVSVPKKNYDTSLDVDKSVGSTSSEDVDESDETDKIDTVSVTPSRQSARTAGKKFNFAEGSSDENNNGSDDDGTPDAEETDPGDPCEVDVNVGTISSKKVASKKNSKDSHVRGNKLVQANLSALFAKVDQKGKTVSRKELEKPIDLTDSPEARKSSKRKAVQAIGKNKKLKESSELEDDIEEFSSESQNIEDGDEDWMDE